ncbi:MAG: RES family NAD+ phosphorylase [Bryobacter sp.]|nr:RES family NAD+ phosphorylase [Bryobacter sp.]
MLTVYRVCRSIYADRLDGQGAKGSGGRWNEPGLPVVYTAASIALAVLENLVHMERQDYPVGYSAVSIEIPGGVSIIQGQSSLLSRPGDKPTQIGSRWLRSLESAVLEVASAVSPLEKNYLLNPLHPEFELIRIVGIEPYLFDPRLFPRR